MKQINFNDVRLHLSDDDVEAITLLLTHRCRQKTVTRVRSILKYGASFVHPYGIFNRIIKENDRWSYCAGQSYPDEIRTCRELILKG